MVEGGRTRLKHTTNESNPLDHFELQVLCDTVLVLLAKLVSIRWEVSSLWELEQDVV